MITNETYTKWRGTLKTAEKETEEKVLRTLADLFAETADLEVSTDSLTLAFHDFEENKKNGRDIVPDDYELAPTFRLWGSGRINITNGIEAAEKVLANLRKLQGIKEESEHIGDYMMHQEREALRSKRLAKTRKAITKPKSTAQNFLASLDA